MNHSESFVVADTPQEPQGVASFPRRDGSTYVHERDARRLSGQHCRVLALMKDGKARTLAEIAAETHDPEASVSARLRDLRKPRFGGYVVEREYVERGLFRYRLKVGQLELMS